MIRLLYTTLFLLPAFVFSAKGDFSFDVMNGDAASKDADQVTLHTAPDSRQVVATPAVMLHRKAPATDNEVGVLSLRLKEPANSDIQTIAHYSGGEELLLQPRSAKSGEARWLIQDQETFTSATLSLRSPAGERVTISEASIHPLKDASLGQAITAVSASPLHLVFLPGAHVSRDFLTYRLEFPRQLRARLAEAPLTLKTNFAGEVRVSVPLSSEDETSIQDALIDLPLPDRLPPKLEASLLIGGEEELLSVSTDLSEIVWPRYEVAARTITDYWAGVRNGELVLYVAVSDTGLVLQQLNAPPPADAIWVAAGDGLRWPLNEPVLRTARMRPDIAGGFHSFSAAPVYNTFHLYFAVAGNNGSDTLNYANSTNSLRVTPVTTNPVSNLPELLGEKVTIHDSATLAFNDSRIIYLTVSTDDDPTPKLRLYVTNMKTRLNDLGFIPVPAPLPSSTVTLSAAQAEGRFYLLGDDRDTVYVSEHPLFGWERMPLSGAPDLREPQLLHWLDQLWYFGLHRIGDREVVTWYPVEEKAGGFEVINEFDFDPPSLYESLDLPEMKLPLHR